MSSADSPPVVAPDAAAASASTDSKAPMPAAAPAPEAKGPADNDVPARSDRGSPRSAAGGAGDRKQTRDVDSKRRTQQREDQKAQLLEDIVQFLRTMLRGLRLASEDGGADEQAFTEPFIRDWIRRRGCDLMNKHKHFARDGTQVGFGNPTVKLHILQLYIDENCPRYRTRTQPADELYLAEAVLQTLPSIEDENVEEAVPPQPVVLSAAEAARFHNFQQTGASYQQGGGGGSGGGEYSTTPDRSFSALSLASHFGAGSGDDSDDSSSPAVPVAKPRKSVAITLPGSQSPALLAPATAAASDRDAFGSPALPGTNATTNGDGDPGVAPRKRRRGRAFAQSCWQRFLARLPELFPPHQWLRNYSKDSLKLDLLAGISTSFNILPKSLAFALLAGLPPDYGLYSALVPALVYMWFGTSRHLGLAPSALVALLTGAIAKDWCSKGTPLSGPDQWYGSCNVHEYEHIVRKLAFIQGAFLFTLGILKSGWLLRFFSRPLLTGFLSASAVIILASQMKYLIYNSSVHIDEVPTVVQMVYNVASELSHFNVTTFFFSMGMIVIIYFLKKWKRTQHSYSLIIVIVASLGALFCNEVLGANLYITGRVQAGLPSPNFDFFKAADYGDGYIPVSVNIRDWIGVSAALALVGFMESSSAAQMYAMRNGYTVDMNQELVAVGLANIFGSIFKCMPIMGTVSMTAMMSTFGARTQLAGGINATMLGIMSFATIVLYYLPKCALSLLVLSAVWNLIDVQEIKFLYRGYTRDLWILVVLVVTTLYFGIDTGLMAAIFLNVVSYVYRSGNTEIYELGRVPGTQTFRSLRSNQPLYVYNGVVIMKFNGPIFFGNEAKFKDKVYSYMDKPQRIWRGLIVDCSSVNFLDATGVHALEDVYKGYLERGLVIVFAHCNRKVVAKLRVSQLMSEIGTDKFYETVSDALTALMAGKVVASIPASMLARKEQDALLSVKAVAHAKSTNSHPASSHGCWDSLKSRLSGDRDVASTPLLGGKGKGSPTSSASSSSSSSPFASRDSLAADDSAPPASVSAASLVSASAAAAADGAGARGADHV